MLLCISMSFIIHNLYKFHRRKETKRNIEDNSQDMVARKRCHFQKFNSKIVLPFVLKLDTALT